jgi:hypothetical protein
MCAWTAKGMQEGAADRKLSASAASCSTFAFGSTSTCNLAKATTGLGVALWSVYRCLLPSTRLTGLAYSSWLQQSSLAWLPTSSGDREPYAHAQRFMVRLCLVLLHRKARTSGRLVRTICMLPKAHTPQIRIRAGRKTTNPDPQSQRPWTDRTQDGTSAV